MLNNTRKQIIEDWEKIREKKWRSYSSTIFNELETLKPNDIDCLLVFIESFIEEYSKNKNITLYDMLFPNTELIKKIKQINQFRKDYLSDYTFLEYKKQLISKISFMLSTYEMPLDTMPTEACEILNIEIDALKCIKGYNLHQFKSGKQSKEPLRFAKKIYAFFNLSDLLEYLFVSDFNGIQVHAILDKHEQHKSYFVFAIKNGENIYILTDTEKTNNPIFNSRTPGRELSKRAEKGYFPYKLLISDIDKYYVEIKGIKSKEKFFVLEELQKISTASQIWIFMMFDLINETIVKTNKQMPELSYYNSQCTYPLLDNKSKKDEVAIIGYKNYELPALHADTLKEDIKKLNIKLSNHLTENEDVNWLLDRYKDQIKDADIFACSDLKLIDSELNSFINLSQQKRSLAGYNSPFSSDYIETESYITTEKGYIYKFKPNEFGTQSETIDYFAWITRLNYCVNVNYYARKEYLETKEYLLKWIKEKLLNNLDFLYLRAIKKDLFDSDGFSLININMKGNYDYSDYPRNIFLGLDDKCIKNNKPSVMHATFRCRNANDLALLCGCNKEELPEILQHYTNSKYYDVSGVNTNLYYADPATHRLAYPWYDLLSYGIKVVISKTTYNQVAKENGIKIDVKPWEKEKGR